MAIIGDSRDEAAIPLRRLVARAARLSSPLILALFGLVITGMVATLPAALALVGGLAFGGLLALARERRLLLLEKQLSGTMAKTAAPAGSFDLLGGDALPVMAERVEQSLRRVQARQDELDQTLIALLDALPDPLLLVRDDRQVERANHAASRLLETDGTGKPIETVLRDPGLLGAIDDVLGGGQQTEIDLQRTGPPTRAFRVRLASIRWRGRPAALVSMRELTEQVMIERMRTDFVANVSHELRTPLTVLRGFIETLTCAARDDPEARARFLKIMGAEAERMSRLVDDLLSLSRIEQNEHLLPGERVAVGRILGEVRDALKPYADERRVELVIERAPALPSVVGDHDQLTQLFTNLIDNAIKYGGEDGLVRIEARHETAAAPGAGPLTGRPALEIRIRDHGPGIEPEHLPRLTERFFRADPGLSRRLGGTGLGLAIVKHILRRHRGHLRFESEIGQGTTVTVYLPVAGNDIATAI